MKTSENFLYHGEMDEATFNTELHWFNNKYSLMWKGIIDNHQYIDGHDFQIHTQPFWVQGIVRKYPFYYHLSWLTPMIPDNPEATRGHFSMFVNPESIFLQKNPLIMQSILIRPKKAEAFQDYIASYVLESRRIHTYSLNQMHSLEEKYRTEGGEISFYTHLDKKLVNSKIK